ncbi:MAG: hypothetical protein ACYTF7_04105 [Planctomycetota bacterium]|jgi:hypothetical protein
MEEGTPSFKKIPRDEDGKYIQFDLDGLRALGEIDGASLYYSDGEEDTYWPRFGLHRTYIHIDYSTFTPTDTEVIETSTSYYLHAAVWRQTAVELEKHYYNKTVIEIDGQPYNDFFSLL